MNIEWQRRSKINRAMRCRFSHALLAAMARPGMTFAESNALAEHIAFWDRAQIEVGRETGGSKSIRSALTATRRLSTREEAA